MNGSHVSLRSAPLRTPLTRSALSVEAGQPTACAISLSVQRRMPYSSESCIKHITLIQTPFRHAYSGANCCSLANPLDKTGKRDVSSVCGLTSEVLNLDGLNPAIYRFRPVLFTISIAYPAWCAVDCPAHRLKLSIALSIFLGIVICRAIAFQGRS